LGTRISASALAGAYVWCWLVFHTRSTRVLAPGNAGDALLFGLLMVVQWLVVVACLHRGRRRGDRLLADNSTTAPSRSEAQFGIRQVFLWTSGIALLLGVARLLTRAPGEDWLGPASAFTGVAGLVAALIAIGHAMAGLTASWAVFGLRHGPIRAPAGLVLVIVATCLQAWLYRLLVWSGNFALPWWLVHNLADFALVVLTLVSLRFLGYQLSRRTAAGGSPGLPATGPASSAPG
jgi:hypothetical protein